MKKILIIEDNLHVRENTAEILELANYMVTTAENGRIGIDKAKKEKPDLILCDIMMPELNGYDVLDVLSKQNDTGSIPFVFLTAKTEKSDIRKGMNLGADDYLTKPFNEPELLEAIQCRLNKNAFLKKEFSKNIEGFNQFIDDASEYLNLESLAKDYNLVHYKKKDTLFMQGDAAHNLYFVQNGTIKTFQTTESGKDFVTGLYGNGDFIGQLSLLNTKGTYVEAATVLEDANIYEIPKADFIKLLYGSKVVSSKFISMVSNNLIEVQEKLMNMAFAPVRQRAAKALLALSDKGLLIDHENPGIRIAREDFAGIIGTATETAIRMLTEFKEEGLISIGNGRNIIIENKDRLLHISNFAD
ncbi:response regulator [Olleya namhaensis]|uniref:response regulator n=1 Tax=Olleya namhaensis TaxID=1144750 RepID=UPI0024914210|nr:response regulator [Olleya namhaensis]